MATKMGKKAPHQVWVLMYRGGLTGGRIAELVRAAPKTVGYHLPIARANCPGLQAAHEAVATLKPSRASMVQGLERMQQLVAMVHEPSATTSSRPSSRMTATSNGGQSSAPYKGSTSVPQEDRQALRRPGSRSRTAPRASERVRPERARRQLRLRELPGADTSHVRHFEFSILRVFSPGAPVAQPGTVEKNQHA